ncbi:MAG: three-Cys-motif partner protein TcmP [Candidatus Aquilonibacter sp.]
MLEVFQKNVLLHAIIQEYSAAFTSIMTNAKKSVAKFQWDYVDGYAAAGLCRRKESGEIVKGSALNSLDIDPPFSHFTFIELDPDKYRILKGQTAHIAQVECINSDTNVVMPRDIVPRYEFSKYRRAFCLLDPYQHKDMSWSTIEAIGRIGTIDLLVHFPTMPMNRGALHRDGEVSTEAAAAMTRFWGDDGWREAAYVRREGLFTGLAPEKATDIEFAQAFCRRLKDVAGFHGTTAPIPMKNTQGAIMYYLIFALPIETARRAANGVAKYFIKHPHATSRHASKQWRDAI